MATDRPRIQAYVEPAIHDSFLKWKHLRGVAKDSEALNQLLAEYFGVSSQSPIPNPQFSMTEEIQEYIEERCGEWATRIKAALAEKLPSRSAIGDRVAEEINARIEQQSEFWYNKLCERLYIVEQRLDALRDKLNEGIEKLALRLDAAEDSLEVILSDSPSDSLTQSGDTRSPEPLPKDEAPGLEEGDSPIAEVEGDTEEEFVEDSLVAIELPSESLEETSGGEEPPFNQGDTFEWWGEEVRVERIGTLTLYCHYTQGDPARNISYTRVSFEEARNIKTEMEEAQPSELPQELPGDSSLSKANLVAIAAPLTQTELAKRLLCHKSIISRHKESGNFEGWSRERDPDAIAWRYDRKKKLFVPI